MGSKNLLEDYQSILNREKKRIIDFISEQQRIYLYGAGNVSKAYLDIIQQAGRDVDGYIVSLKQEKEKVEGYHLYDAREAGDFLQEKDGVILAFNGVDEEEIKRKLLPAKPQLLYVDISVVLALDSNIRFAPVLKRLEERFANPKQLSNNEHYDWKNILVIRLDMIGDMIFTIPMIRELKNNFPKSNIIMVARKQNQSLLEGCPYLSETIFYECPFQEGELSRQCEQVDEVWKRVQDFNISEMKERAFDAVFLAREFLTGRNILDELFLAFFSRAHYRIARRIEINDIYSKHLYDMAKPYFSFISLQEKAKHEVEYSLGMLLDCGLTIQSKKMELWPTENSRLQSDKILPVIENRIYIALGIVASVAPRTWNPKNYATLIKSWILEQGSHFVFVLFGGGDAIENADEIVDDLIGYEGCVANLAGKTTLSQTIACIEKCSIYVGSNTGLLHVASALNIPSVTIYAELKDGLPTDGDHPNRVGAWMVPHVNLVPPAGLDGCHRMCRKRYSHCINQIDPMDVMASMKILM